MDTLNFEALFLGPQAENRDFLRRMLTFMLDEHIYWRRNFHPEDGRTITRADQNRDDFVATQRRLEAVFEELSSKLKQSSLPHHSPRHLAHMASDVLMPAVIAYLGTVLYNPNNIAWEGSPATTPLEQEVGIDFAKLVGYDPEHAFGHLTSGGHAANYEALWIARNLKSIPLALQQVNPEFVDNMDEWQLMNLAPQEAMALWHRTPALMAEVRQQSVHGKGMTPPSLGKVFVAQSKHYSWGKAVDLLGLGQESLVSVRVTEQYRMDVDDLNRKIRACIERDEPILAVVAIVGTTEEGAVDPIDQIVALRKQYEAEGISFYIHVDAAYGGYIQSIFLDEQDKMLPLDEFKRRFYQAEPSPDLWPPVDVYHAYQALSEVDSITLNPHKLGYVPFGAGGVVFKDGRMRNLISHLAPYIFGLDNVEDAPFVPSSV
ncbi:MAG: pyridoxal-dependent decarboxylase [Chloroflexota bacterium]